MVPQTASCDTIEIRRVTQEGDTPGCCRRLFRSVCDFMRDFCAPRESCSTDAPFAYRTEVQYFLREGMPLCLASFINWGLPPLVSMAIAGQTGNSAHLQVSLGYGRIWYICTIQMATSGCMAYFINVVPGCIGAGRQDRMPRYFQRSLLLTLMTMIPFYVLQFYTGSILHSLGVALSKANHIGDYCKLMVVSSVLDIFNCHFQCLFQNLGYIRYSLTNSIVGGLLVDTTCNFLFVFVWGWGLAGAAWARIAVQIVRLAMWFGLMCWLGLVRMVCFSSPTGEPLCSGREIWEFVRMGVPTLLSYFGSWLIFELQLMGIANIASISREALAAGAIWVQLEGALAAAQEGWITSTSMRVLALMGKKDPGARSALKLFHALAALTVAIFNVLILYFHENLCRLATNDVLVQQWLCKILWMLTIQTQTRISGLVSMFLYVPVGKGRLRTLVNFTSCYLIAGPIVAPVVLTDLVTTSVSLKLEACVSATSIAQFFMALFNFIWLQRLNWTRAAEIVHRRANTDICVAPSSVDLQPLSNDIQPQAQSIDSLGSLGDVSLRFDAPSEDSLRFPAPPSESGDSLNSSLTSELKARLAQRNGPMRY